MFNNWGAVEWFILIIDVAAVIIVIYFLKIKIKSKLKEVEERQNLATSKRRKKLQS